MAGCFRCQYKGCDDCGYPEIDYTIGLMPKEHYPITRKEAWKPYKKKRKVR